MFIQFEIKQFMSEGMAERKQFEDSYLKMHWYSCISDYFTVAIVWLNGDYSTLHFVKSLCKN